ncbi:unnamed protein product [Urochloa humidicola]
MEIRNLSMSRANGRTCVTLFADPSNVANNARPIVSFSMKLLTFPPTQTTIAEHPGISNLLLQVHGFAWTVESFVTGRFLVEMKFLDMKIAKPGGGLVSVWPSFLHSKWFGFTRMLQKYICTDIITVNCADGSIKAHSLVLAAHSPVFQKLLTQFGMEKQHFKVEIPELTIEEGKAYINYMYGNRCEKQFTTHRLPLLAAANKYDVCDLKIACLDSLLNDTDTNNLIERLQMACFYQLPELKRSCLRLLVDFMKLYEIRDDFNEFIMTADRALVAEILQYVMYKLAGLD